MYRGWHSPCADVRTYVGTSVRMMVIDNDDVLTLDIFRNLYPGETEQVQPKRIRGRQQTIT